MNKRAMEMIKSQKNYYRDLYRKLVVSTWGSFFLTLLLATGIAYQYFTRGESSYYASNAAGAGFITELSPLDTPNLSSTSLLKPDPPEEITKKRLPRMNNNQASQG